MKMGSLSCSGLNGGRPAFRGEIPYQVQLQNPSGHVCGGAILATYLILTAAHCFDSRDYKEVRVVAGQYNHNGNSDFDDGTEQYRNIKKLLVHPEYDSESRSLVDDVALLVLDSELEFNNVVQSILIPRNETFDAIATVSGWGISEETSSFDQLGVLNRVDVILHNSSYCDEIFEDHGFDSEIMICAGGNGSDACLGYSGGPLTCIQKSSEHVKRYVCGITSGGSICTKIKLPGVYTKISEYHDWILEVTEDIRPTYNCSRNYFRCSNFMCIPKNSMCDGFDDCADGSDEKNCRIKCSSLADLSNRIDIQECDGIADCDNGLDEINCNSSNVTLVANPECSPIFVKCDMNFSCTLLSDPVVTDNHSVFLIKNSQIFVDSKEFRNDALIFMQRSEQ